MSERLVASLLTHSARLMRAGFLIMLLGVPAAAQDSAGTIRPGTIARYLGMVATDSRRGRATPSSELDTAAAAVGRAFARLGLEPGACQSDSTGRVPTWIQRYPVPGQRGLDFVNSSLNFMLPLKPHGADVLAEQGYPVSRDLRLSLDAAAYFVSDVAPPAVPAMVGWSFTEIYRAGSARVVLVSGLRTLASLADTAVQGKVVLYVTPAGADAHSAGQHQILMRLYAASEGVVLIEASDSARFAARLRAARTRPVTLVDGYLRAHAMRHWPWIVSVWPGAVRSFVEAAGVDLDAARQDATPVVRELPGAEVWLDPNPSAPVDTNARPVTAPNVIAVLEGADSELKHQYVIVSAHLDDRVRPLDPADTIVAPMTPGAESADDNAAGVAGLLALAEAFGRPGARPPRSLLFVATSGGVSGRWGSYFLTSPEGAEALCLGPSEEKPALAANLTLDRIGRAARRDTVAVAGAEDIDLVPSPFWVAEAHGELGLTVRSDGDSVAVESDHIAFVRNGIPSLYVHGGAHTDPIPPGRAIVDTSYAARVVGFAFHLVQTIATAPRPVGWTAAGRRKLFGSTP